jgi:hypothetical protein
VIILRVKSGAFAPITALFGIEGLAGPGGWASRKTMSPINRAAGIKAAVYVALLPPPSFPLL